MNHGHGRFLAAAGTPLDGVELGDDGTPIAFRIWKFGDNPTDMGVHRFTDKSAAALMASQEVRGNEFSIDVDHLSLSEKAPPESRKAVGFHRLPVRPDGLWAVDVRWAPFVAAGLKSDPPEWRYFSPAYNADRKSGEITEYLNTALTNNPRTWNVTALASQPTKGKGMKFEDCLAALMGDDEDKKKEAMAAMKAAFGGGEKPAEEKKEVPEAAAAAKPFEGKETPAEEKAETETAALVASLASTVKNLAGQVDAMTAEKETKERNEILAARPDLPKALLASLVKMPMGMMRETISALPKAEVPNMASSAFVRGTHGEGQTGDGDVQIRAARLPADQHAELAERMGVAVEKSKTPFWERGHKVYENIDRATARQYAAAKKIVLPAPAPILAPFNYAGAK